jgi:hypothetical protein
VGTIVTCGYPKTWVVVVSDLPHQVARIHDAKIEIEMDIQLKQGLRSTAKPTADTKSPSVGAPQCGGAGVDNPFATNPASMKCRATIRTCSADPLVRLATKAIPVDSGAMAEWDRGQQSERRCWDG